MDDKRIVQFRDFGLGNISVDSFVFGISRGGNLNWLERAFFVDKIRNIVDQFPKFNVTVFDYDSTIYDLILGVKLKKYGRKILKADKPIIENGKRVDGTCLSVDLHYLRLTVKSNPN
uniref:Uncharacterized protein n=1 Tax=Meloidogyne javanica TaxID=6303 RepID=A0A915M184_MELJA